jgi:hypothetical protein
VIHLIVLASQFGQTLVQLDKAQYEVTSQVKTQEKLLREVSNLHVFRKQAFEKFIHIFVVFRSRQVLDPTWLPLKIIVQKLK